MSTKINDAFKYNGTINELIEYFNVVKKNYYNYLSEKLPTLNYSSWIFKKNDYPFLEKNYTLDDFKKSPWGEYDLEKVIDTEIKRNTHHPYSIEFSAVVYFNNENIYIQFFGIPRTFKLDNKFEDYHYQNQCDMSNYDEDEEPWDSMTTKRQDYLDNEWEERRKVWDNIFTNGIPIDCGLLFSFIPTNFNMTSLCNKILNKNWIKPLF